MPDTEKTPVPHPPEEGPDLPGATDKRWFDYQKIALWLRDHWEHGPCPVCHSTSFQFGPLLEVPSYDPKMGLSRSVLPVFGVSCETCGYLLFFNALAAGIVAPFIVDTLEDQEARRAEQEADPYNHPGGRA